MHNLLSLDVASKLKSETQRLDSDYSPGIPPQDYGEGADWTIMGPPSKHRYLSGCSSSTTPTLHSILTDLLPSEAFRAWLGVVSSLVPTGHRLDARRFRKGLDYTLASGEDKTGEARLDVMLGATWWADVEAGSDAEDRLTENGGWECYLASPDEDEDPAVYQGSRANSQIQLNGHTSRPSEHASQANGSIVPKAELEIDADQLSDSDFDDDEEEDQDDDPLLTLPVGFNKLSIVLRDPGVMRFVKYLSASALGSRWDVGGEWEVGILEEDSEGA